MAVNVTMYSPRLPFRSADPIIRTGAPTNAGGIAGVIASGIGGWTEGKQQKQENRLATALNEARVGSEEARQAYWQAGQAKGMNPQTELLKLQAAVQGFYKPVLQGPVDPTTSLPTAIPMVNPITGKAVNQRIQTIYDRMMSRIDALQGGPVEAPPAAPPEPWKVPADSIPPGTQVSGIIGVPDRRPPGLAASVGDALESSNRKTGERVVNGKGTGEIRPEFLAARAGTQGPPTGRPNPKGAPAPNVFSPSPQATAGPKTPASNKIDSLSLPVDVLDLVQRARANGFTDDEILETPEIKKYLRGR